MLRVACVTQPKKMPFQELGCSFAAQCPGGRTQTQHTKVCMLEKSSGLPVARAMVDWAIETALKGRWMCREHDRRRMARI